MKSNEPRISFGSDLNTEKQETNKGLKLKSKKDRVPRADRQAALNNTAKTTTKKLQGHLQEALELGQEFIRVLNNKKVPEQKGPMEESLEKEVARNWQKYIIKINNDENQPEGMGSASAFSLIFSCLLKLRDKTNIIEHDYHLLKQENIRLKKEVSEMSAYIQSLKDIKTAIE